jgi:hypothetical protein
MWRCVFACLAAACCLMATLQWIVETNHETIERRGIHPRWPEYDLGHVVAGRPVEFLLELANRGSCDARVINVAPACGLNACVDSTDAGHLGANLVGPGMTVFVSCQITVVGPGPFACPVTIFVDDGGLQQVDMQVRGTGLAREKQSHE